MVFSWFKSKPAKHFVPEGTIVYAIGDVHGRDDLLKELIEKIGEDIRDTGMDRKVIFVFLGDYVDRGMGSKSVIDLLLKWEEQAKKAKSKVKFHLLRGNHEEALLQFLDDPLFGEKWVTYGGAETLMSYGVQPPRLRTDEAAWIKASKQLGLAMSQDHLHFLQGLEPCLVLGDYIFVHAGLKPGKKLEMQQEQDMLWIRNEFIEDHRKFEKMVVHGHTPEREPFYDHRRIGLDTGAYITGVLTAARLVDDQVSFLQTGDVEPAHGVAPPA
ncbi:MAG: serine/threonine protein phosphatase [Robiginitomaculum sp.]|nr:MAG: serine/threonine protein phosphatase [Robiginitomaculum sp.]